MQATTPTATRKAKSTKSSALHIGLAPQVGRVTTLGEGASGLEAAPLSWCFGNPATPHVPTVLQKLDPLRSGESFIALDRGDQHGLRQRLHLRRNEHVLWGLVRRRGNK